MRCGTRDFNIMLLLISKFHTARHSGARTILADVNQTTFLFEDGKGYTTAIQGWTVPECSRRMRLPDFMTIGI
jgi:hypothetical protein